MTDRYRYFFDSSRDGMYITTRNGLFVDANQAFCSLLHYSREELLALPVEATLALPLERRRFKTEIEANGSVAQFRIKLLTKAGAELVCTIDALVLRTPDGEIDGYMGVVRPARHSVASPIHVDLEVQHYSLALRGANDGLWEWDLRKNLAWFSSRWKALLGYATVELSQNITEWFDRIHPEDLTTVKQNLNQYLKGQTSAFSAYFRMQTKAGDWLWLLGRAVGEFDESGKCVRLGGSLSNVTAHIKMIENLKSSEDRLTRLTASLATDKALLSRYFSGEMLQGIFQGSDARIQESLGPAAILVVHLNRVTGAWSKLGTAEFGNFLNEVITDLMDLIYGHKGSVNKILGDTILASFGAPLAEPGDLTRALTCAQEIRNYLKTYNDVRPTYLKQDLSLSLGLAWGEVFSATLGSVHRLEYSLVGQPLNRAEALQKTAEKTGNFLLTDASVTSHPEAADFDLNPLTDGDTGLGLRGLFSLDRQTVPS